MPASPFLIIVGVACLLLGSFFMRMQIPREDKPQPAWMRTDTGSTALALGTFMLLIFGVALLFKGF